MIKGIDVRVYSVENGYIIEDYNSGGTYVTGKLESYSLLDPTVVSVLRMLESKAQQQKQEQQEQSPVDLTDEVVRGAD